MAIDQGGTTEQSPEEAVSWDEVTELIDRADFPPAMQEKIKHAQHVEKSHTAPPGLTRALFKQLKEKIEEHAREVAELAPLEAEVARLKEHEQRLKRRVEEAKKEVVRLKAEPSWVDLPDNIARLKLAMVVDVNAKIVEKGRPT